MSTRPSEVATEKPNALWLTPSLAVSLCAGVHVVPDDVVLGTNVYTAPSFKFDPTASALSPTTRSCGDKATAPPKLAFAPPVLSSETSAKLEPKRK
jgi:hypothetical protein